MPKDDAIQRPAFRGRGEDDLLHGKVAKLLNVQLLVLNIGSKQGVTEGMEFAVLNRNAGDILDPDTQEVLGSISLRKVRVTVETVFDQLSVAEVAGGGRGGPIFPSWLLSQEGASLKRSAHPEIEEIDEKDSIVKVGDEVVEERKEPKST
jgi:hypothetical protein